jgi:hypothetical protein
VVKLAAMVEHFLTQLFLNKMNLKNARNKIQVLEKALFKGGPPSGSEMITDDLRNEQKQLRQIMYKTVKDYIEIKYNCDEFLAETVAIQNFKKKQGDL